MKRSRHDHSRGPAVLRFFICLLIVIILVLVAVFLLSRGKNLEGRPYVVTGTGEPATPPPATVEATLAPTSAFTVAPTVSPSPTPTPAPTPVPTPTPTFIPDSMISGIYKDAKLPDVSTDGDIGISGCFVSALNDYHVMELTGWGYANLDYFDGETCGTYLVVTQMTTGNFAAYFASNSDGISGVDHSDAVCKNPSTCDWRAYIDVSKYDPGNYSLGLVLVYKNGTRDEYRYYEFGELQSFTVNDGEIITPVTVTDLGQN